MIVLTNTQVQTLAVGQSLTFDSTVLKTGCSECHRTNSTSIKLKSAGLYEITFSGNVASTATGQVNLQMELGGEPLPETIMTATIGATTDVINVGSTTIVRICCNDYSRVSITNTGDNPITVEQNACIVVRRVA